MGMSVGCYHRHSRLTSTGGEQHDDTQATATFWSTFHSYSQAGRHVSQRAILSPSLVEVLRGLYRRHSNNVHLVDVIPRLATPITHLGSKQIPQPSIVSVSPTQVDSHQSLCYTDRKEMSITQPNSFGRSLPSSTIPNSRSLSRNPPTTSFSQPKPDPVGFNYEYVRDPDGFLSNALRSLYDTGIEKACPSLASMLDRHKQNYDNESNYLNQALSLKLTDNERDQTFVTLETNRCEALYKTIETLRSGIKNGDVVKCLDPAQLEALTGTRDKLKMMSKFNPEP